MAFAGATEERTCGNSRGQLKKKWNFQWCFRKIHVEFSWVLVSDLGVLKGCHTQFCRISRGESLFFGISKARVAGTIKS